MDPLELAIGDLAPATRRAKPRKAALEALELLLRAHALLSEHRDQESPYGALRPATEEEIGLIEAVFLHCGVPLPDTLRAIYRRTLGLGNPVSPIPVLAVPFLRAALPDEGFGCPIVGIEAFEKELGVFRDELALERPPFLHLGHAAPAGLSVSRNGLWSIVDVKGQRDLPPAEDFNLVFEAAFCAFVEQVLLLWANDLAGAVVKRRHLDLARGGRLAEMPDQLHDAMALLVAPRRLRVWGEVWPVDNPDLVSATRRTDSGTPAGQLASRIAVVGLPYVEHPEEVARIAVGDLLRLHPVDDNPHDPFAVEVWQDGERPVRAGFVERRDARHIRALPGGVDSWRLRVADRSERVLLATLERDGSPDAARQDGEAAAVGQDGEPPQDLFSRR